MKAQIPAKRISPDSARNYSNVITQARYPDGPEGFYKYISQNVKYPESAVKAHIQGKVFVAFLVQEDGSLNNVKVVRGLTPEIDSEAVRVIKASPNWIPGKANGRNVRQQFTVPINFGLPNKQ